MKQFSIDLKRSAIGPIERMLFFILVASASQLLGGQTPAMPASEAVNAHFTAAQQAQRQNDYPTAEREYHEVLAAAPEFAEAHMNLGLVYQLQNRFGDAMAEFRRALKIKPGLTGANFFLGVDYCRLGDGAAALPHLRAAVSANPRRPETWLWLATAQKMSGRMQAEASTLKRALTVHPQNIDLLYLLGQAYERMGKTEVAGLARIAPASSWSEQLLGESYLTGGDWTFAVIRFQNALALPPPRPGIHVEMGEVLLRARRLESAAHEFDQELQLDSNNVRALVRRGEVKLIQGDAEACMHDWARALAIDAPQAEQVLGLREIGFGDAASERLPDPWRDKAEKLAAWFRDQPDPAAHFALAFLALQAGNSSDAAAKLASMKLTDSPAASGVCTERVLRSELNGHRYSAVSRCFPGATRNLPGSLRIPAAQALFEVGDYEDSLKLLSTLAERDAHSPPAYYGRARCYEKLAMVAYLHLYQADPDSYRVHQLLGDLDAVKGDDKGAIEEYRAAIAQKPSVPNLHYSLGHLLWKNLQTEDARTEFDAELAINPGHAGALHDLGNTYLFEHQPEKALPLLIRAQDGEPGDLELHRDLGSCYTQLRDYRRAEAEFKIALAADDDGSVHYKLARVYQTLGEKDKAATEFALSAQMNHESHRKLEQRTDRITNIQGLPEDSSEGNQ
jgi:tetratricopeptide (TPR) repeat protein